MSQLRHIILFLPKQKGFSLVELLVSLGILAGIVLLVNTLTNGVTQTTMQATKKIESDSQARQVLARMASDFSTIVDRRDVNFYFRKNAGNDEFYFFSRTQGHLLAGASADTLNGISLIGYRVSNATTGRVELERLAYGLHWRELADRSSGSGTASSMTFLPLLIKNAYSQPISETRNNSSDIDSKESSQWDVVGSEVFRLEVCFLLIDGTTSAIPVLDRSMTKNNLSANVAPSASDDSTQGYSIGSRWYDTGSQIVYECAGSAPSSAEWKPIGLEDVSAVVVSLALLPSRSRLTTTVSAINAAGQLFPDFTAQPLAANWGEKASNASSLKNAGMSAPAASSVRIYERSIILK